MPESDVSSLTFVDPAEAGACFRVVLWAAPGEGKTVGAASAPKPIVAVSADRPGAYRFARRHHGLSASDLREVRYQGPQTLTDVHRYLADTPEIRTVILDPWKHIYDAIVDVAPASDDGGVNYQWVNKYATKFLYSLRAFDVNVVIVAHEKLNDGKKGDGKLYPDLGGAALINKVLAESDIVAHVERVPGDDGTDEYVAQLKPVRNLVCKQSTGIDLGDRAPVDLSAWFAAAVDDNSDLPWTAPAGEVSDHEPSDETPPDPPDDDGQTRLAA